MSSLKGRMLLFLSLFAIWLLLTYPITVPEAVAGAITALIITAISGKEAALFREIHISIRSAAYGIAYLFVFFFELVKSNIDVAFRVLHPKLPIHPGIVKVKTKLKSRLGRMILANSITLTPGTITVETEENYFYIHWVDVRTPDIEESTKKIVLKFEKYLEVICG